MLLPDETATRMLLLEEVRPERRAAERGPARATAAERAPPASLPGLHFAAALLFLGAGAAALVWVAPDLAATNVLGPRVAALTHLFTLGWMTTSIMGALYQFLPVALEEPIRWVKVAYATLLLYVPGVLLFVLGLWQVTPHLMLAGTALLAVGVLLFVGNMVATLHRAVRRDVTWWALACATFYLGITLLLGLALAGNLKWGYLGGGRLGSIGVHLHVALAGWVLLVMIGVARRLLPMFLLSHGAGDGLARAAVVLVSAGAGVLALLHHAPRLISYWLPALLLAAGCAAFLLQARRYYVTRHRRALDPGMRLAAGALCLLLLTLVLAGPVVLSLGSLRTAVAYVSAAVLGITLFIVAHYYRIVPFLVWYHRFGPLAGRRAVPGVHDLYSGRLANTAGVALFASALGVIAGVALGSATYAQGAAVILLAGVLIVQLQMLLLWRVRT
jgi:hypothetical protein